MAKRKRKRKYHPLTFYGKPLVDLTRKLTFTVTEHDSKVGARRNGEMCPGARGIRASCKLHEHKCLKAEVHRSVIYMDFGDKVAYRGVPSAPLHREVISQDKGGKFDAGTYEIHPAPPSWVAQRGSAHSLGAPKHGRDGHHRPKKRRLIIGIRKLALESANVSRS